MDKYVGFNVICNANYNYFGKDIDYGKLEEYFEHVASMYIKIYKNNFLFYYDNNVNAGLLHWFVYFKKMVLPELNITVVFDADFNAEKLDKQQNYFYNYITNFVNIVYLPEQYKSNPLEYIKKLSYNLIKLNPKQYY